MGIGAARVQARVKTEVARILQTEMNDPRMGFVTVISCDLSADYKYAKIYVAIIADTEGELRTIMRMLADATGYIQRKVAGRLRTRHTPALTFILDKGAEHSVKIGSLLDQLKEEREAREAQQTDGSDDADADAPDPDGQDA